MKKIMMVLMLALTTVAWAKDKVVEMSGKEPKWIYGMNEDYIIASGEGETIDAAQEQAMLHIKAEIANSVASSIKVLAQSNEITLNHNEKFDYRSAFMQQIESRTAPMQALNEISVNKAEAYYWEKIRKDKNQYFYRYHIKYRFTRLDLMRIVDEFKQNEAKLNKRLQEFIDDDFSSYSTIEQMEKRVLELQTFQESLDKDDDRRATCKTVLTAYRKYFEQITLRLISVTRSELVFAPYYGNNRLTTNKQPQLKTNCLTELQYINDGSCRITYNFQTACYEDEQNWIEVAFTFGGKKTKNTFYVK